MHRAGPDLAGRGRAEHDPGRRRRRHAVRAQGRRVRAGGRRAVPVAKRPRGVGHHPGPAAQLPGRPPRQVDKSREKHQGRDRGDHHRRAPAVRDGEGRQPAVPGDQRQRLGDQVQVRQQVRLPALAHRRHQARHRRPDRRQGHGGVRLRRRRQGLLGVPARPGRAGHRDRGRPDLRAAGGHGRLPGRHLGGCRRKRGHLRHRHRQPRRDHRGPHEPHEAPGHRGQHRPLRQRDRHDRPGQDSRRPPDDHQAAGRRVGLPKRTGTPSSCCPRAAC